MTEAGGPGKRAETGGQREGGRPDRGALAEAILGMAQRRPSHTGGPVGMEGAWAEGGSRPGKGTVLTA